MNDWDKTLVEYRIQRAWETFNDAKTLAETQSWHAVANRLYYAAFYIVLALLIRHKSKVNSHKGVRIALHRDFIKTKMVEEKWGKFYMKVFDKRLLGDYHDFATPSPDVIKPLIPLTKEFIETIENVIKK